MPLGRVVRVLVSLAAMLVVLPAGVSRAQTAQPLEVFLFDAEMWSATLQQEMVYRVYLPPDYFQNDERRYPTLYMLHGAGGNYTEWSDSFLPEQLDDMIGLQLVQPMIVVMPDGGSRTYWANWEEGPRWSDYVAYDVVNEIDGRFRTIPSSASRAIGGVLMRGLVG